MDTNVHAGKDKHLGDVLGVGDCPMPEAHDPDGASSMPFAVIVDDRTEVCIQEATSAADFIITPNELKRIIPDLVLGLERPCMPGFSVRFAGDRRAACTSFK